MAGEIHKSHVISREITWKSRHLACDWNTNGLTRFFMRWRAGDYILYGKNSKLFNVQRPPHAHMKVMYTFHFGSKLSKCWRTSQMAWFHVSFLNFSSTVIVHGKQIRKRDHLKRARFDHTIVSDLGCSMQWILSLQLPALEQFWISSSSHGVVKFRPLYGNMIGLRKFFWWFSLYSKSISICSVFKSRLSQIGQSMSTQICNVYAKTNKSQQTRAHIFYLLI
jgi:hypothetical protein